MGTLKLVTITGAADDTDPRLMQALSDEFPFVEWGLLFSRGRCGLEPRYPSLKWLESSGNFTFRRSVHLCGNLARRAAQGYTDVFECVDLLIPAVRRVQLNISNNVKFHELVRLGNVGALPVQVIIQVRQFADAPFDRMSDPVLLHDRSGGRGLTGDFETPINAHFTGFAGGIGPSNITETIERIQAMNFPNDYWIDMESGVRQCDQLHLGKVRVVLKSAAPFITTAPEAKT